VNSEWCRPSEGGLQIVPHQRGIDADVSLWASGGTEPMEILEAIDHGQLGKIRAHAMLVLEEPEHTAPARMQEIGEACPMGATTATNPHQQIRDKPGVVMKDLALGVEKDWPEVVGHPSKRLAPGVGQLVVAALTPVELDVHDEVRWCLWRHRHGHHESVGFRIPR
jgi:hypothetical protein